eukprot:g50398.t1
MILYMTESLRLGVLLGGPSSLSCLALKADIMNNNTTTFKRPGAEVISRRGNSVEGENISKFCGMKFPAKKTASERVWPTKVVLTAGVIKQKGGGGGRAKAGDEQETAKKVQGKRRRRKVDERSQLRHDLELLQPHLVPQVTPVAPLVLSCKAMR